MSDIEEREGDSRNESVPTPTPTETPEAAPEAADTNEIEAEAATEAPEPAPEPEEPGFSDLGLVPDIAGAVEAAGYETPSPIQAATIPKLLSGRDLIGQAQTGTGKTAAFALPILQGLDLARREPQAIVLTPTRELAIQVAEAFQKYASRLEDFHVLPIYGGQAYPLQLRPLQRGVHVVVGTPGRVIDHLERGSLDLSAVRQFVLDEADEMLNMGFVEDVDRILASAPDERQIVLFSATMPPAVQGLAETYMRDPEVVRLEVRTRMAETIRQRSLIVKGNLKLDALTRILETEEFDAMLIFVRTKSDTVELAEKLAARGHASAALNGDMPQKLREHTIDRLRDGKLDILVATDVAARGLDVARVTHVLNYDMPTGIEPYTHRIGRTGRAGRTGEAILFVKPQERRLLRLIQNATTGGIEPYAVPTTDEINASRVGRFKRRILEAARSERSAASRRLYGGLMREVLEQADVDPEDVFAALAEMAQGDQSLLFRAQGRQPGQDRPFDERDGARQDKRGAQRYGRREEGGYPRQGRRDEGGFQRGGRREEGGFQRHGRRDEGGFQRHDRRDEGGYPDRGPRRGGFQERDARKQRSFQKPLPGPAEEPGMTRYRIEVGHVHGAKPGSIVGAVTNEGGITSEFIGRIQIFDAFSTIDLSDRLPRDTVRKLQRTRVRGQQLRLAPLGSRPPGGRSYGGPRPKRKFQGGGDDDRGRYPRT